MARKKRDAPISYRPPSRLREEFASRVQNSGLTTNAFITAAVFGKPARRARRSSPLDFKTAAMLLSQAARIADRLAECAEDAPPIPVITGALQECRNELAEIRGCLMDVLGRDP